MTNLDDTAPNGWPRCDFCGQRMETDREACRPHVYAARCSEEHQSLTFASCRYGHRHCAWEILHPLPDDWPKDNGDSKPSYWKDKARRTVPGAWTWRAD